MGVESAGGPGETTWARLKSGCTDPMGAAMTAANDLSPTLETLDARVVALENGSNSWAALVGEDVRRMHQELAELRSEVAELRARVG